MKKIQNNIYKIEYPDIFTDHIGKYIVIEDYLNVSITYKNKLLQNPLTIFISYSNNEEEPPPIYSYGEKKIYLTTNLNETFIVENYKLIVNNIKQINNLININKDYMPVNFTGCLYSLFYQNINLYTQKVNCRQQNENQQFIVNNPIDNSIKEIKIANHIVYNDSSSNEEIKNYLPKNNQLLQKIYIKLESNQLQNKPPLALQLQILDEKKQLLFQLKNNIQHFNYENNLHDNNYNDTYGHIYGFILDENDKSIIAANIWSNEFEYNSNVYIIEWYLTKAQMKTLNYYIDNNLIKSLSFQIRYAAEADKNNNYIWRGWSNTIKNIFINIPPPPPSDLKMLT